MNFDYSKFLFPSNCVRIRIEEINISLSSDRREMIYFLICKIKTRRPRLKAGPGRRREEGLFKDLVNDRNLVIKRVAVGVLNSTVFHFTRVIYEQEKPFIHGVILKQHNSVTLAVTNPGSSYNDWITIANKVKSGCLYFRTGNGQDH